MTSPRTVACCAVSVPTLASGRVDRLSILPHLPPMPKTTLLLAFLLAARAPMLAMGGSLPIGPKGYRAGVEGTFASGKYHSTQGAVRTDLGTLRTGTLL